MANGRRVIFRNVSLSRYVGTWTSRFKVHLSSTLAPGRSKAKLSRSSTVSQPNNHAPTHNTPRSTS